MIRKYIVLWIGFVFLAGCGTGKDSTLNLDGSNQNVKILSKTFDDVGLEHLNNLRNKAGMTQFTINSSLNRVAQNHALYQVDNNLYTHSEQSSNINFSGGTPSQRILNEGYPHKDISENIYAGDVTPKRSIDILFSNIYHRLAFLDFGYDEIGLGTSSSDDYIYKKVYTYEIGRANLRSFNNSQNPKIVVWPYENQQNVLPVFYEENPDPLPECSVSGYPVSLQFNPSQNGKIKIESFKLYDSKYKEIKDTVLLDLKSDFVLMPLKRLEWGSNYHVSVKYSEDGMPNLYEWEFATQSLPEPYFIVNNPNQKFNLKSAETYYFYLPPKNCNDKFSTYTYSYSSNLKVEEKIVDNNTIKIKVTGKGRVEVKPDNGRNFILQLN
jgi:uncharacterized protein YkwD